MQEALLLQDAQGDGLAAQQEPELFDFLSKLAGGGMAGYIGKRLGGISWNRMARYVHRDGSTLVRDIGRLEQRLTKDTAKRRRAMAITRTSRATSK